MKAWDVYRPNRTGRGKDKQIDTVFFDEDCSAQYVLDSLINHDGYAPDIYVVCSQSRQSAGRKE